MYSTQPSFILGFHGCDRQVGEAILSGKEVPRRSENAYDWLGDGVYFWENSPERALSYAEMMSKLPKRTKGKIDIPFVIGAVIDLGSCLNLTDENALLQLQSSHVALSSMMNLADENLPINEPGFIGDSDKIKRHLDCAVIMLLHKLRENEGLLAYDSIRSPFFEGGSLYDGSLFTKKAHVQVAVRNLECIKGYFRPLTNHGQPIQP